MPLLLNDISYNDKLFIPSVNDNPKKIKEELYLAIQNLPMAEELEQEIEKREFLDQTVARDTREKHYIIVTPNQSDKIYIGGTDGLHICLGIAVYDPESHKLAVAHFDVVTSAEYLPKIFNEFANAKSLELRFFGGIAEEKPWCSTTESEDSVANAKEIYLAIYEYSQEKNIEIKIRSSNTFEKLNQYKQFRYINNQNDATVGFAINSINGKVLVFPNTSSNSYLPYTTIDNCGIFSGIYKRSAIYLELRFICGFDSQMLIKQYDGSDMLWNTQYENELEKKSKEGLINLIVKRFRGTYIAT